MKIRLGILALALLAVLLPLLRRGQVLRSAAPTPVPAAMPAPQVVVKPIRKRTSAKITAENQEAAALAAEAARKKERGAGLREPGEAFGGGHAESASADSKKDAGTSEQ